jgi:hypothetical protein
MHKRLLAVVFAGAAIAAACSPGSSPSITVPSTAPVSFEPSPIDSLEPSPIGSLEPSPIGSPEPSASAPSR